MYFKLKRTKADIAFSNYIRRKAKWVCEFCHTDYSHNHGYLDCSHFFSRQYRSVRFDPLNAICADKKCHDWLGKNPDDHRAFFVKRLGNQAFDLLEARKNTPQKVDEALILLWCQFELKKLDEAENDEILGKH